MIDIIRQMRPNPFTHMEDLPVILFEGEQFAHRFRILPMAGVSFDGYQVTARFIRADGQEVAPGGTVTDGAAQVVLTPACYAVPGNFKFFIYVVSESETVCVYACAGNVQATVGRNGQAADPSDPIIESYGGGDSRYRFDGGPNGTYTEYGVTVTNDGRLYTLSGTGNSSGNLILAPLDGCVSYNSRTAKVHLTKGRSYRFSLRASKYPTYQSGGETLNDYGAFALAVLKGTGNGTQFILLDPSNMAWDTPGNVWTYYAENDEDVWLRLAIACGKSVGGELQGYNMNGIKLLIGIGETDGTETGHVNKDWTAYGETKLKVAAGRTLTIGATTLSDAELIALKALLS